MSTRSRMRRAGAALAIWSVLATLAQGLSATAATTGRLRVISSPAVSTQILVDGSIADTWGLTWVKETTGPHTVCFTHVDGWTEPACQSVTVSNGATITVTGNFTQRGELRVINSPAVASAISVDGNPTNEYGMWTDIQTGAHTVCWGKVVRWNPPACQNVTVNPGATTTVTGTFTNNPSALGQTGVGLLRVKTSPAVPSQITITPGAGSTYIADQWSLTWLQLRSAGSPYTVCFSHLTGWTEPACQTVTVRDGATTVVTGAFTQRGFLRVLTSPAAAGTIMVDGVPRNDWGMWTDMPTGSHTVCFGSAAGFGTPPACQTVTVNAGVETDVTGTYPPSRGSLIYSAGWTGSDFDVSGGTIDFTGSEAVCHANAFVLAQTKFSPATPASFWAEIDMFAAQSANMYAGWYLEGASGQNRHFHFDFLQETVQIKNGFNTAVGPTLSLPGIGSGTPIHLAAIVQSPRYRLVENGAVVYDYTDPNPRTDPGKYGFDCANNQGTSGLLHVTGLRLYTLHGT